jgi:RNA polymerase sigma-70 factor (ECF subfamily)
VSACTFPLGLRVASIRAVPGSRADDRELAARLMAGEPAALAEAYDAYAGVVFGAARRVLGDDGMAEDVVQEVFANVWQHPERYDAGRGSFKSWLGVQAHHRSVDRVRVESRRTWREAHVSATAADPEVDSGSEVDESMVRAWLAEKVRAALDRLPPEQREVVVLAYFGGRTYRQVAVELAIPEGTAKSRLRLALAKLQELLAPTLSEQDIPAWT